MHNITDACNISGEKDYSGQFHSIHILQDEERMLVTSECSIFHVDILLVILCVCGGVVDESLQLVTEYKLLGLQGGSQSVS